MQKREGACESYRAASSKGWKTRRGEIVESDDALDHTSDAFPSENVGLEDDEQDLSNTDEITPSWMRKGRGEYADDLGSIHD